MPGGGKSTIGRQLARRLGRPFVDTDQVVERRVGCDIRTFFEREGETRFRDIEQAVLAELASTCDGVLATGGGIVLRSENRRVLQSVTCCVYLRSTPEELFRRLRHDTRRPLLQVADPLGRLRDLYEQRHPLYAEAAHFSVETGRSTIQGLVQNVLSQLPPNESSVES